MKLLRGSQAARPLMISMRILEPGFGEPENRIFGPGFLCKILTFVIVNGKILQNVDEHLRNQADKSTTRRRDKRGIWL